MRKRTFQLDDFSEILHGSGVRNRVGFPPKGGNASTFTLKAETFPPLLKVDTWWDLTQSTGVKNFLDTSHGGVKNFLYTSGGEV